MLLRCGRTALRPLIFCALAVGSASYVLAAEPVAPDEGAIALDQAIQGLKDEALQFNRDALMAEDEFLYPSMTRVSIYISNRVPNLLLDQVSLQVDGAAPVTYTYDEFDSRALLRSGALQRLVHQNLERGAHRIKLRYSGRLDGGRDDADPLTGEFDAVFDKGFAASEIELQITRGPRRNSQPAVKLKEWRVAEE